MNSGKPVREIKSFVIQLSRSSLPTLNQCHPSLSLTFSTASVSSCQITYISPFAQGSSFSLLVSSPRERKGGRLMKDRTRVHRGEVRAHICDPAIFREDLTPRHACQFAARGEDNNIWVRKRQEKRKEICYHNL